mgnify:CR=1 FL=1
MTFLQTFWAYLRRRFRVGAYENLITNISKVKFTSIFPSDKIAVDSTISYSVATSTEITPTVPNPTGKKGFLTISWTVDGTNYYPAQAYTAATNPYAINGWVSTTDIGFIIQNFSGSTKTFTLRYVVDNIL